MARKKGMKHYSLEFRWKIVRLHANEGVTFKVSKAGYYKFLNPKIKIRKIHKP